MASYPGSVHPKTEPQDVDMKTGEVQVKMEPEMKERGEKGDHGGREVHSDNDSSATCSADEDVEAEPERRFVIIITFSNYHVVGTSFYKNRTSLWFCFVLLQNILHGKALIAQPSRVGAGVLTQAKPTQHPAAATAGSCYPTYG